MSPDERALLIRLARIAVGNLKEELRNNTLEFSLATYTKHKNLIEEYALLIKRIKKQT